MTVRSTTLRSRPSPARRRRASAAATGGMSYAQARAVVVLSVFILFFGTLWLINGEFTARFVGAFGASVTWGWALHLANSVIEVGPAFLDRRYMGDIPPRLALAALALIWLLTLPFGVLDVLSSALGIAPLLVWTGARGGIAVVQNVGLAEVLAFAPEPMLVLLLTALRNVLRGL